MGVVGKIVSFLFFGMVAIAAITSVISLLEVVIHFLIQKFPLDRKKALAVVGAATFLLSIPIGISLGYTILEKEGMTIAGFNWLDFFDQVGNTVLMPVCAFGSCIAISWCAFKGKNNKERFGCKYLSNQLESEGLKLGKFSTVFAFMVKYVTPLLIVIIEIFGIINVIFPTVNGVKEFSIGGLVVVLTAVFLIILTLAIYFIFLKNKHTGSNDDEIKTEKI